MRILSILMAIAAGGFWYIIQPPTREEWSITILEWEQLSPAPIWQILLGVSLLLFVLSFFKKKNTVSTNTPNENPPKEELQPKKTETKKQTIPNTANTQTKTEDNDWRARLFEEVPSVSFPRGGKILLDAQKEVPFTLRLPHKTQQAYKESIDTFCQWLSKQPTPKRAAVRFDGEMTQQEQNIVRGIFRKYYHINEHIIQQTINGVDIIFSHPNRQWDGQYNLSKDFS